MRFHQCSSCFSPHAIDPATKGPANKVHQRARHHSWAHDPFAPRAHGVTSHVTSPITTLPWWNNMTVCHLLWIVFLSRSCGACASVMVGTDTTLDQGWGTDGSVWVFIVSLSTTSVGFSTWKLRCIPIEYGSAFVPHHNYYSGHRQSCVASLQSSSLLRHLLPFFEVPRAGLWSHIFLFPLVVKSSVSLSSYFLCHFCAKCLTFLSQWSPLRQFLVRFLSTPLSTRQCPTHHANLTLLHPVPSITFLGHGTFQDCCPGFEHIYVTVCKIFACLTFSLSAIEINEVKEWCRFFQINVFHEWKNV